MLLLVATMDFATALVDQSSQDARQDRTARFDPTVTFGHIRPHSATEVESYPARACGVPSGPWTGHLRAIVSALAELAA